MIRGFKRQFLVDVSNVRSLTRGLRETDLQLRKRRAHNLGSQVEDASFVAMQLRLESREQRNPLLVTQDVRRRMFKLQVCATYRIRCYYSPTRSHVSRRFARTVAMAGFLCPVRVEIGAAE